jgi:hypothetical protein
VRPFPANGTSEVRFLSRAVTVTFGGLRLWLNPPYEIIASKLTSGKIIPFLGPGASFGRHEPADSKFDPVRPRFLPMATELAVGLAEESSFPSDDVHETSNLAKVSSCDAEGSSDRPMLRERLRVLLDPSLHASAPKLATSKQMTLHQLLASAKQSPSEPLKNLRQREARL